MKAPGQRSNPLEALRLQSLRREFIANRERRRTRGPGERFVLFGQGRSGTTLLMSTLGTHSAIYADREILGAPKLRPYRFTDDASCCYDEPIYGYKVKIYHLLDAQRVNPATFLQRAHRDGWLLLYLYRSNVVEQAVSNLFALEAGRYHHFSGGDHGRPKQIIVAPAELVRRARQRLTLLDQEREALAGLPHLAMNYERDLRGSGSRTETLNKVQDYLGVTREALTSRIVKSVNEDLASVVGNWSEVADAIEAAGLGEHLPGTGREPGTERVALAN